MHASIRECCSSRSSPRGGRLVAGLEARTRCCARRDVDGGANVSALFFNADLLLERYNMPDTLKAQYTAFLTRGRVLMSDMGRVLCSVVEDTCGWHDTLCGHSDAALGRVAKYGRRRYQEARNEFHRNARDKLLVELGKVRARQAGRWSRTSTSSARSSADDDGRLSLRTGHSRRRARTSTSAPR